MIIIINGPPGVGKSTIADKLSKKLKKAVVVEVDKVKFFAVDDRKGTPALDIGDQQVFVMVKALKEDKEHIILDYIYYTPRYFDAVVAQLKKIDRRIFAYRLRSSSAENIHRDGRRPRNIRLGNRVTELGERLDNLGDNVGYTVETTGLSVEKTAAKIAQLLNADIGRV